MPDLNVLLTLAGAVLILVVPGLLLALSLRIRGWAAAGIAPLLTFALVVIGIVVASALGIDWTPLAAGAVALAVIAVTAGVGSVRRSGRAAVETEDIDMVGDVPEAGDGDLDSRAWSWLTVGGLLLGAGIGFSALVPGTGDLARPNQGFDALFHVNLVETISRSGEVSPGVAGSLNGYAEGTSVYPDAFHAVASLLDQLFDGSLQAINALLACVPLLAGLGLVGLLRSMGLVRAAAVAPVVLASTTGYPTDPIWQGPIWVFAFGIALVPAFLLLLRLTLARRQIAITAAFGVSTGALAVIHPSAALSASVFGICWVAGRWIADRSTVLRDLVVVLPAALVAAVLALPLIGQALVDTSGGTVVDWPVAQSAGEALGELLLYNYDNEDAQLWLALPAAIGLAVGWRLRGLRWWYAGTGVFATLCVLAAAFEGPLVEVLTGPWWNDRFRFAAVVFLGLSVFGALGIVALGRLVAAAAARLVARGHVRLPARRSSLVAAGTVLVVAVLAVLSGGFYVADNRERLEIAYVPDGGGAVSGGDLAAFDVLAELAGDGPVLNDPNDGSAWMWALGDVRPVFGAALTFPVKPPLPDERQLLVDRLNCVDSSEDVRQAIEDLGVRYVYSSESTILGGETPNEGFRDLASVESLRPVYEQDGATVYEIAPVELRDSPGDACRLG